MKIKYVFLTGERIEIEVSEGIGEVALAIDQEIHNRDRRETRRHESYSGDNDKREVWVDLTVDVEAAAVGKADKEILHQAISRLKLHQRELVWKIFYQGLSETEVARERGVTQQAVSKQLKVIYKNLKNSLE